MKLIHPLALISCLLVAFATKSQSINPSADTIKWVASHYNDLTLGRSDVSSTTFMTFGTNKVKWTPQASDTQTEILFDVDQLQGDWSTGHLVYDISRNGKSRQIKIDRDGSGAKLTLTYIETGGKERKIEYIITEILKVQL